jgi:hypothetical protein
MGVRTARSRVIMSAALAVSAGLSLTGCVGGLVLDACPAIGYLYNGPAVVQFDAAPPESAVVTACFGADCEPAEVDQLRGEWTVPQEAPYLGPDVVGNGSVQRLRLVVVDGTRTLVDDEFEIPVAVERTGMFGQCSGPFRFEAVQVSLGDVSPELSG